MRIAFELNVKKVLITGLSTVAIVGALCLAGMRGYNKGYNKGYDAGIATSLGYAPTAQHPAHLTVPPSDLQDVDPYAATADIPPPPPGYSAAEVVAQRPVGRDYLDQLENMIAFCKAHPNRVYKSGTVSDTCTADGQVPNIAVRDHK